jgi:hypothetical protein
VGSSLHRVVIVRGVLYNLWVCLSFVILQKEGFLPIIRGPLWPSPTSILGAPTVTVVQSSLLV